MVKQQEHGIADSPTLSVVGWKKFWVVFSNAWTEKFSQYVMTLHSIVSLRPHLELGSEDSR